MNFVRKISIFSAVAAITLTTSAWAANDAQHDSHHTAATATVQFAQATTPTTTTQSMGRGMGMGGMGAMPGYSDQMKAMQVMHDKMQAAKTPEERNTLMTEQMKLMQNGMGMMGQMGQMGSGAMAGKPGDMAARQGMMEQRMEMMQSMMQMMLDRVASDPATK